MNTYNELAVNRTKLPSFLYTLLEYENEVLLVSLKNKEERNADNECKFFDTTRDETESSKGDVSSLNLTGNPLKVDLSVSPIDTTILERKESMEETLRPIGLNLAREFINDYNEDLDKDDMVVCVCDGEDDAHTIMLASSVSDGNFVRTMTFADGPTTELILKSDLNRLLDCHIKNVGMKSSKVDTQVLCLQNLYGNKLFNYNPYRHYQNIGNVQIESSWDMLQYDIPEHGAVIKLILQVIVGHESSTIYSMFQELQFIQYCLDQLSNNDTLENLHLSQDNMESDDLYKSICDVIRTVHVINLQVLSKDNLFDFEKDTNLTDKLWNIFKRCGNINDLSDCFKNLFEMIVDQSINLQILEDERNTMLGEMLYGICSGRITRFPDLSSKQCLESLVELGLHKLKRNYFTIIKSVDFQIAKDLQDKWNTLLAMPQTGRATFTGLNVPHKVSQLHYLYQIHSSLEFLPLVSEARSFPRGVLVSVLKNVLNKYVMNTVSNFTYGIRQLCDIAVPICFADINSGNLLSNCIPTKYRIRMSSNTIHSSVITSFHYTREPLFPNTIYKYNGVNNSAIKEHPREPQLYITRLETYSDKIETFTGSILFSNL